MSTSSFGRTRLQQAELDSTFFLWKLRHLPGSLGDTTISRGVEVERIYFRMAFNLV